MTPKSFKISQKESLAERNYFKNIKQTRRVTWKENQDSILTTRLLY